ncbi:42200_t:CDS:2, partial [Gigaspora margarita]
YIYTGIFSVENNVSFVEIFISADEIKLFELCKQLKEYLLETGSAWKFPKDFIMLCQHNDTDLYNLAFDLVCKSPKVIFESKEFLEMDFVELEKTMHNCIPHIRFFQMSLYELRSIKAKYKNILPDLSDEIFHNLDPSRISTKNEAIIWCNNKGPCFGSQDLWIQNNSSRGSTS